MRFTFKSLIPAILTGMVISVVVRSTTLDVPNSFTSGTKIVASQMNANFNAVETWSTQIASDNIVDGGIASQDIATSAIATAKIQDLAVTTGKINDLAVTSAKLADLSVTDGKLSISSIATATIATAAIINAKIASGTITRDKFADGNFTDASLSCSASGAPADVTCAVVQLTPRGRPFFIGLTASGSGGISCSNTTSTTAQCFVIFDVGSTEVYRQKFELQATATNNVLIVPGSAFWTIYTPAALLNNTTLFRVSIRNGTDTTVSVSNVKLVVFEL